MDSEPDTTVHNQNNRTPNHHSSEYKDAKGTTNEQSSFSLFPKPQQRNKTP